MLRRTQYHRRSRDNVEHYCHCKPHQTRIIQFQIDLTLKMIKRLRTSARPDRTKASGQNLPPFNRRRQRRNRGRPIRNRPYSRFIECACAEVYQAILFLRYTKVASPNMPVPSRIKLPGSGAGASPIMFCGVPSPEGWLPATGTYTTNLE